jgi:hypothetical protein
MWFGLLKELNKFFRLILFGIIIYSRSLLKLDKSSKLIEKKKINKHAKKRESK